MWIDKEIIPQGNIATSYATSAIITPGCYVVEVIDAKGCKVSSRITCIEQPKVKREFQLCFRWSTPSLKGSNQEPSKPNTVSNTAIAASNMSKLIQEKAEQCATKLEGALTSNFANFCMSEDHLSRGNCFYQLYQQSQVCFSVNWCQTRCFSYYLRNRSSRGNSV